MSIDTIIALLAFIVASLLGTLQYFISRRHIRILERQVDDSVKKTEALEKLTGNLKKMVEAFLEAHHSHERHLESLEKMLKAFETKSHSDIDTETLKLEREKIKAETQKRKAEQSFIESLFDAITPG